MGASDFAFVYQGRTRQSSFPDRRRPMRTPVDPDASEPRFRGGHRAPIMKDKGNIGVDFWRGPPGLNRHNVRGNTMVSSLQPLGLSVILYYLFKLALEDAALSYHATMAMVRRVSCCRSSMLCRPYQCKGSLMRRFRGRSS
jgi:hypothetical protein